MPTDRLRPAAQISALLLASVLMPLLTQPAWAAHYQNGDHLQFTGLVTDTGGKPVPDVKVVLEVARTYLSLRELRRAEKDMRRVSATTNAQGEYTLEWIWDGYFNHFELLSGVDVRRGKEVSFEVLEREDATQRVQAGSPIVSTIVIHNRAFVDRLHDFLASIQGEDEHRTYEEMGTPDDVKRVNYSGRPIDDEVTWWYFDSGKVYRYRGGKLIQVDQFDPVQRFSSP